MMRYLNGYPALYASGSAPFWDDEHISAQMLKAHLDPNTDAASRKPTFIDASVDALLGALRLKDESRLLDLGCGPGLYAEGFARRGVSVTGVDISRRSLAYARERAAQNGLNVKYINGSYLDAELGEGYDAAILIYCDFGVLSPADRAKLLRRVFASLRTGGALALDAWALPYLDGYKDCEYASYSEGGFFLPSPHIVIERDRLYRDTLNTLEQYIVASPGGCECYNTWNQIFTADSLREELSAAGFGEAELYDDAALSPYTGNAETLCAVARKA